MRAREFLSEGMLDKIGTFFRGVYGKIVSAISNAIESLVLLFLDSRVS